VLQGSSGATLRPVFARAAGVAAGDGPISARIDAAQLLGLGPVELAFSTLPELLDARQPTSLQLAAIQTLAALSDRRVGSTLLGHWRSLSPSVRREAVEALFARSDRIEALLDAIEQTTIAATDIDPARRKQLLLHTNASYRARAAKL